MQVEAPVGDNENRSPLGQGWRKSSYSMSNGHCVEIARFDSGRRVGVRDSTAVSMGGPVLRLERHAWAVFLNEIRASVSTM